MNTSLQQVSGGINVGTAWCYQHRAVPYHITVWGSKMADGMVLPSAEIVTRAQAKRQGMKRYFTGKLCPRGHISERYVSAGSCCECHHEKGARLYAEDPTIIKRWVAKQRETDPNWERAAKAAWIAAHPTERAILQTASRLRRGEKPLLATRLWRLLNKDHVSHYNTVYAKTHMSEKLARDHKRRAAARNAPGYFIAEDINRIYLQQRGRCAYCPIRLRWKFHRDHIVPLSRGGTNWPNNIQLLCRGCNQRKHATMPLKFARDIGLLI